MMKTNWISLPLDSVASIDYGTRVVQKKDGGSIYPVYGGGGETFRMDKFNRQDILVISRFAMSAQCTRFVRGPFFLNDSGLTVSTKSNFLSQAFLEKYLIAHNDDIYFMGKGMAQKNLDMPSFRKFIVSFPESVKEQQRIVDELDLLTGIIDKKNAQLRDLDALAQSIFYDMFGDPISNEKKWALSTIDRVCKSIIRGPFGSALKKEFFVQPGVSTYKVYEQKHAIQKSASIGSYYIDNERFLSLSRFSVEPGDIIMSCSGTIGELFTIPENSERGIINQALLLFRLNSCIERTYFLFVMEALKSSLDTKGAGIQNIGSVKFIKSMAFAFPDLSLQRAFSQKISRIEKMKSEIESSLKEATDLYNCRMDMYFNL